MDALTPIPEPATSGGALQPQASATLESSAKAVDCWNRIGVTGDGSCAELATFVHCRNCPVYSAAGLRLLDRERPVDYQKYWTDYFAREKKSAAQARLSAVIFQVGAECLALSTRVFLEVAEPRPIHTLPHRRNGVVLGLTNVRGQLLVCISLGRLLGIERGLPLAVPGAPGQRLMVLESAGSSMTFPVDDVHGVHRFHAEDLHPAPPVVSRSSQSLTQSMLMWKDRKVSCLDEDALFAAVNRSFS